MSQDQRYEYKTVKIVWGEFEEKAEETFNKLAKDGWELKASSQVNSHTTYYIFERPVQ